MEFLVGVTWSWLLFFEHIQGRGTPIPFSPAPTWNSWYTILSFFLYQKEGHFFGCLFLLFGSCMGEVHLQQLGTLGVPRCCWLQSNAKHPWCVSRPFVVKRVSFGCEIFLLSSQSSSRWIYRLVFLEQLLNQMCDLTSPSPHLDLGESAT